MTSFVAFGAAFILMCMILPLSLSLFTFSLAGGAWAAGLLDIDQWRSTVEVLFAWWGGRDAAWRDLQRLSPWQLRLVLTSKHISCGNIEDKSELVALIIAVQASLATPERPAPAAAAHAAPSAPSAPPAPRGAGAETRRPLQRTTSRTNPATNHRECGVCCAPMGPPTERQMATAGCGHMYCALCWEKAVDQYQRCPACRARVRHADIIIVYV